LATDICFYFQVHQPFRIRKDYHFFDIGHDFNYEDHHENKRIMQRVAQKCYLPANYLMLNLIKRYQGNFKISYSISGSALEQFEKYAPEVLDSFHALVETGHVELLGETNYHSLAFLKSKDEFKKQVEIHRQKIKSTFGVWPTTFRNTELIYNDDLAATVGQMGFKTILAEGADHILNWRSPNFVYNPANDFKMKLLLKNYRLSDDIAFRFSSRDWKGYPLTAEKYASWLHSLSGNGEVVGLFMDYETFGEHQWKETGIFDFLEKLPEEVLKHPNFRFRTPSEISRDISPVSRLEIPHFVSWADTERNLSAWLGNPLQNSAFDFLYSLERPVLESKDLNLIHTWRKLQTSDHFYYLCTKWFNDGDVHKYFNPFGSPYDAFISYTNVLNDLKVRLEDRKLI